MFLDFILKKNQPSSILTKFATKSFSEAIILGITILVEITLKTSVWGTIVTVGAKGVVDDLFEKDQKLSLRSIDY